MIILFVFVFLKSPASLSKVLSSVVLKNAETPVPVLGRVYSSIIESFEGHIFGKFAGE